MLTELSLILRMLISYFLIFLVFDFLIPLLIRFDTTLTFVKLLLLCFYLTCMTEESRSPRE
jgi:hypothetical protein